MLEKISNITLSLLLTFLPLIIFVLNPTNFVQLNMNEIKNLSTILLGIFFIFILTSLFVKNIFAKYTHKDLEKKLLFFFSLAFFQFFFHEDIKQYVYIEGVSTRIFYLLSLLIIILINMITLFLTLKYFKILKKISLYFIIILIILNIFTNWNRSLNIFLPEKIGANKNENQIILPKTNLKNNVYFVIMDAMSSVDYFEKNFNKIIDKELKNKLDNNKLIILPDSTSSYNITYLGLTSILYANYPITDKKKFISRNFFFPNMFYYNEKNDLGIITYLTKNGNQFKFVGNSEYNLHSKNNYNPSIANKKILEIFNSAFYSFFNPTPFDEFVRTIYIYKQNDAVGRFLEYSKEKGISQTATFYLIHHISPHRPFIFDNDCKKIENVKDNKIGYSKAYTCAFKKIIEFTEFVNKNDPTAFIVFVGDHGADFIDHKTADRFKVISIIKPNKFCENFDTNKMKFNTVNITRLALYCSANEKPIFLENKSFIGYYEDEKEYGSIKEIKIK
jgi:hypothetical protein